MQRLKPGIRAAPLQETVAAALPHCLRQLRRLAARPQLRIGHRAAAVAAAGAPDPQGNRQLPLQLPASSQRRRPALAAATAAAPPAVKPAEPAAAVGTDAAAAAAAAAAHRTPAAAAVARLTAAAAAGAPGTHRRHACSKQDPGIEAVPDSKFVAFKCFGSCVRVIGSKDCFSLLNSSSRGMQSRQHHDSWSARKPKDAPKALPKHWKPKISSSCEVDIR